AAFGGLDVERVDEAEIDNIDWDFGIVTGLELVPDGLLEIFPDRAFRSGNRLMADGVCVGALDAVKAGLARDEGGERSAQRLGDDDLRAGRNRDLFPAGNAAHLDVPRGIDGGAGAHSPSSFLTPPARLLPARYCSTRRRLDSPARWTIFSNWSIELT